MGTECYKNAFRTGTTSNSLNIINNRLTNRSSYIKYNNDVIGPINDTQGVEQGRLLSDRLFRLAGSDQLLFAQISKLGVPLLYPNHPYPDSIPKLTISAIGQADDTALFSNDLFSLNLLASLSDQYAVRSNTIFVPDKTKLVAFVNPKLKNIPPIEAFLNPVSLSNTKIPLSNRAEHVGVIRESTDIFPHILNRITAHKKASSLIRFSSSSHTNVHAETCFCTPILLSGLSSLVIDNTNMNYLETYFKGSLKKTLRLPKDTPDPFVYLISGTLPISALIYLRQLSLLL